MPKAPCDQKYSLRESPFFRLRSRKKLAKLLRVSTETLDRLVASEDLYVRLWKHKERDDTWLKHPPPSELNDHYRPIDIPDPLLKETQSRTADLLARIDAPDFLFSPVKGRSYVDNAAQHVDATAFWLLDVADYFPSCSANNVARFFLRDLECSPDVVAILTCLVTTGGCLPQGSPCSPVLAYYSNRHVWLTVNEMAKGAGCNFSLYADDITISGPIVPKKLIWEIKKLLYSNGLRIKARKEVSLIEQPAEITGVIVKKGATYLPNRQLKRLAELKKEFSEAKAPKLIRRLENQIAGRLAQLRQVQNPGCK